jgi:hypothetical protein
MWKIVVPAIAILILVIGVSDIPVAVAAARDEGIPGTFTSKRSECYRSGCSFYGTFVSDDGAVELEDALIDDGVEIVAERVPAQYVEGSRVDKVYQRHSRDWVWLGLLLAMSVAYVAGWGLLVVGPWLQRRRD